MDYDKKPEGYGAKAPPPEDEPLNEADAEEPVDDEPALTPERIAELQRFANAHPELCDLERYSRDAFAGATRRFAAYLMDCLIVVPTMLLVALVLGTVPGSGFRAAESVGLFGLSPHLASAITSLIQLLLYDTYFTATVHRWGGTWGQKFCKVAVLGRDLAMPSKSQARGRYWAAVLAALPLGLGLLAIVWDRRRRGWHDRMAGTYVVHLHAIPGDIVRLASLNTRDKGESAKEGKETTGCLMGLIMFVFAPGLIVLGLAYLLLKKTGIIKSQAPTESQ